MIGSSEFHRGIAGADEWSATIKGLDGRHRTGCPTLGPERWILRAATNETN
jgi:hypothetical protein